MYSQAGGGRGKALTVYKVGASSTSPPREKRQCTVRLRGEARFTCGTAGVISKLSQHTGWARPQPTPTGNEAMYSQAGCGQAGRALMLLGRCNAHALIAYRVRASFTYPPPFEKRQCTLGQGVARQG
jgi:hypothetical protein